MPINVEDGVEDGAVPEKVKVIVLTIASPALFALKVNVPRSSFGPFVRPVVEPSPAAVNESLLRKTVIVFPLAEDSVMEDVEFEVLPKATTVSGTVSLAVSVDVAILKICVELSVAPDEEYEDTSPFKTNASEFA